MGAAFVYTPRSSAPLTINTPSAPPRPSTTATPHAHTAAKATSPDALPPVASQTSANSGASKRVVSNGEQVVLNSDSDDDSLPDLDWGAYAATTKQVAPTRSRRITAYDEYGDDALRKPEKKARKSKKASEHVFESALKNMESEQLIETHKAGLAREEEEDAQFVFNEDTLGQAIKNDDDPEQAHRLFLAMQRTNAVQAESVFHFFRDTSDSIAVQSKFPVGCLPQHRRTSSFRGAHIPLPMVVYSLTCPRSVCTGPSFPHWLRAPGIPISRAS